MPSARPILFQIELVNQSLIRRHPKKGQNWPKLAEIVEIREIRVFSGFPGFPGFSTLGVISGVLAEIGRNRRNRLKSYRKDSITFRDIPGKLSKL